MTTTTLRPNGTISATVDAIGNPAVVTGAASVHAAMSDNSDSSYASAIAFLVDLTTVSLPAGAVTKTITQRVRVSVANALTLYLIDTTNFNTTLFTDSISPTGSIVTYTGTPRAVTLTQAQIDGLRVQMGANAADLFYELYVDLVYALVPTVAVNAPTGTVTTSTTPTCSWTYTAGSDGDVQSRYQIRVFTAAQYGIGGFDPATSPCTYDTGVVLGAATSATIGPLANSTTYRAYVNVAQTINGTPQWSGYSFSGFTMSVTTADIASVVGTPSNTNANISVVVTRVTAGSPPTWATVEVQRSDDAGATWAYVRSSNGAAVSGTTYTVVDYEAGNGTSTLYRARATYLSGGLPITSAWVNSAATSWTAAADWLKNVNHPSQNRQVTVFANPALRRNRPQGVLAVIGRSDPVIVSDVRSLTSGTLTFITQTTADATDLLVILANDILFIQSRPGANFGQKYIAIADVDEAPQVDLALVDDRLFTVTFNEVVKPIDVGIS